MELEKEMKVVCFFSKVTIKEWEVQSVKEMMEKGASWEKIINYADRNRTLYLVLHNFFQYKLIDLIPGWLVKIIQDSYICNEIRNDEKLKELKYLLMALEERGVKIVPVKGAYLIDEIYDRRIRTTNDLDALILRKDIPVIIKVMKELGYTDDYYNFKKKCFEPVSSQKKMLYKLKMYNLLPFAKEGALGNIIFFDLSHSLDFSLNSNVVEEMINSAQLINGRYQLLPEHFLLHMCCHHYREASHTEWIKLGKDLNLMKFCDVREFVIKRTDSVILKKMIQFARKYSLEKAVYFTFYVLKEIYSDGYEDDVLDNLNILDKNFVFMFGENEYNIAKKGKKSFWRSFFDDNNMDEVDERPGYERIIDD